MTTTSLPASLALAQRSPRRITITIPYEVRELLIQRSQEEGRSLSNLAAYLLEHGLDQQH